MKKSVILLVIVMTIGLSSCLKDSDWEVLIVPAEKILLTESAGFLLEREIALPVGQDTLFIRNMHHVYRACYLKMAFPDKALAIEYTRHKRKSGKIVLEARFIKYAEE